MVLRRIFCASLKLLVLLLFFSLVIGARTLKGRRMEASRVNCTSKKQLAGNSRCNKEGQVVCKKGWSGVHCDVPVCSQKCHPNYGICSAPNRCSCRLGWHGPTCSDCIPMLGCLHGYCNSSFQCICKDGWDGFFCNSPICHSLCHRTRGYCSQPGECKCHYGWQGDTCSVCTPLPGCVHGYCVRPMECICKEGWQGVYCDKPVCDSNCHPHNGYCSHPGSCRCKVGWYGENCEKCSPYPGCKHGTCEKPWECNCEKGWGGFLCDKGEILFVLHGDVFEEMEYCDASESGCMNGGTCMKPKFPDAHLSSELNFTEVRGVQCQCPEGFTGSFCETKVQKVSTAFSPLSFVLNPLEWLVAPLHFMQRVLPNRLSDEDINAIL